MQGELRPFISPTLTRLIADVSPFPLCLLNMPCAVVLSTLRDDRDAVYHIETIFSLETVAQPEKQLACVVKRKAVLLQVGFSVVDTGPSDC